MTLTDKSLCSMENNLFYSPYVTKVAKFWLSNKRRGASSGIKNRQLIRLHVVYKHLIATLQSSWREKHSQYPYMG